MSYHEASQLADMGAKVLHSKTLHPVMQSGIPLLIRNTFAPDRSGTKITLIGSSGGTGLKAVTTASDLGLITVRGPVDLKAPELLRRTLLAASNLPVDVRLATKPISPHDEACIVVSSAAAERTIDALRREFANDSGEASEVHVTLTPKVAIVTIVGEEPCSSDRFADQCLATLTQENVTVLGLTTGSSACSISFVMLQDQMKPSLAVLHRQLEREITQGNQIPVGIFGEGR
jgi:aspartate kinase